MKRSLAPRLPSAVDTLVLPITPTLGDRAADRAHERSVVGQGPAVVLTWTNSFEMVWVDASPDAAEMVDVLTSGYWAVPEDVSPSVGPGPLVAGETEPPVAIPGDVGFPNPAALSVGFDQGKKSFDWRFRAWRHRDRGYHRMSIHG